MFKRVGFLGIVFGLSPIAHVDVAATFATKHDRSTRVNDSSTCSLNVTYDSLDAVDGTPLLLPGQSGTVEPVTGFLSYAITLRYAPESANAQSSASLFADNPVARFLNDRPHERTFRVKVSFDGLTNPRTTASFTVTTSESSALSHGLVNQFTVKSRLQARPTRIRLVNETTEALSRLSISGYFIAEPNDARVSIPGIGLDVRAAPSGKLWVKATDVPSLGVSPCRPAPAKTPRVVRDTAANR